MELLGTLGEVAEVVVVRLKELPNNRNGEDHHQTDGCPDGHGVVAVHRQIARNWTIAASAVRE